MLTNLRSLRNEQGVSQKELADALGTSQQSITQYENQKVEPDIYMLSRMADYFNTSIDYLVGRTEIRGRTECAAVAEISREESEMICCYRKLNEEQRACIKTVMDTLLK